MSSETGHSQGSRRLNLKEVKEAPGVSDESIGMELRAMRLQRLANAIVVLAHTAREKRIPL